MNSQQHADLHVAIIGSRPAANAILRDALMNNGFLVDHDLRLDELTLKHIYDINVDAVLVDLDETADQKLDLLEAILEHSPAPVLFNDTDNIGIDGDAAGDRRMRTLVAKLRKIGPRQVEAGIQQPTPPAAEPAKAPRMEARQEKPEQTRTRSSRIPPLWILGASLGGPAALREFFGHLPDPLPVCFLVVQHIGDSHLDLFTSQLERGGQRRFELIRPGSHIKEGGALVAPVSNGVRFDADGKLDFQPAAGDGFYAPSINSVIEQAVESYGDQVNVIIFSGMGNDGERGCRYAAQHGCRIWVQDSDSCVIGSMPERARGTGAVTSSGTPAQLAAQLVKLYR